MIGTAVRWIVLRDERSVNSTVGGGLLDVSVTDDSVPSESSMVSDFVGILRVIASLTSASFIDRDGWCLLGTSAGWT